MTENPPQSTGPETGDTVQMQDPWHGVNHRYETTGFTPPPSGAGSRPSRGLVAGLLAAALVVGGLGGLAGAAGFSAVDDLVGGDAPAASSPSGRPATTVSDTADTPAAEGSVEQVATSVLPSVVKINVSGSQGTGSGSGIILSADGEILTNNHVVAVADGGGRLSVNFSDGTSAEATVTSGIVSALNRPVSVGESGGTDTTYPAIQTDAAINPGNSGGPLVNMRGEVVGINSSIRTASSSMSSEGGSIGLGFAIPIDNVLPIVDQLRGGETPTHARLGVSVTDATSNDGLLSGAGVQEVNAGSAAEQAGLEQGDVITKVDDQVISDSESLVATIRGYRPGDQVTLTVVSGATGSGSGGGSSGSGSGGDTRTVQVTLDSDGGQAAS